jgi:transposase
MDKSEKIKALQTIKTKLIQWINLVEKTDITELVNFKSLVERHMGHILNYFYTGATNAIAESNNSIIQQFLNNNRGAKNLDFFYFRLSQFLS